MGDFADFKKMITPTVVKLLFWLMVFSSIITGLVSLYASTQARNGGAILLGTGLAWIILGPLVARIWCEILIVIFAINDTLTDIRNYVRDGTVTSRDSGKTQREPTDSATNASVEVSDASPQSPSAPHKSIINGKEFVMVRCPKCDTTNQFRSSKEGTVEHCTKCDHGFVVPYVG